MLNKRKDYGTVYGANGISYWQDNKYYNIFGYEVDETGKQIEEEKVPETPKPVLKPENLVPETPKPSVITIGKVDEKTELPVSDDVLDFIGRLKIEDKNQDGFVDIEEMRQWLELYGQEYSKHAGRMILEKKLKEVLGLE